jgi:hypothetical protein
MKESYGMKKSYYYTIMEGDKFMTSNLMQGLTNDVSKAIRLSDEHEALEFFGGLNKERKFRIVEVECILREY